MSAHLIAMTFGPAPEFICAARRSCDLWFGSRLLSEISRSAAQHLSQQGARLVFPAPPTALDPLMAVPNTLLALLPDGLQPSAAYASARNAALTTWQGFANRTLLQAIAYIDPVRWDEQVNDVVASYAAWAALPPDRPYANVRATVMRLLASRKRCCTFQPAHGHAGIPKSSTDGARESIFKLPSAAAGMSSELRFRLGLFSGEQLDALGLIQRLGAGADGYPTVSRIAADPWLRGLLCSAPATLAALREAAHAFPAHALAKVGSPQFAGFPFEGAPLYPGQLTQLAAEGGLPLDIYQNLAAEIHGAHHRLAPPQPYLAILRAGGHRISRLVARIASLEEHTQFSLELAAFAALARTAIEQHHGALIYAGGDDVLALLPVDTCLSCARHLQHEFSSQLASWCATLSVGIAIAHHSQPLQDLLAYARAAKRSAQDAPPDILAIHLHSPDVTPVLLEPPWSTPAGHLLEELASLHLAVDLPDTLPYHLQELARHYDGWPSLAAQDQATLNLAIRSDTRRLLHRRTRNPEKLWKSISAWDGELWSPRHLRRFASYMAVARCLAIAMLQAKGGCRPCLGEVGP